MDLIPTNRDSSLIRTKQLPAWAQAIRERYGSPAMLPAIFAPKHQHYCATNMRTAIERGVPTLGQIVTAYSLDAATTLMETHIVDAVLRMGEDRDVDSADARCMAQAICESERFRLLRLSTLIGFFYLLRVGEFEIYGRLTPRKVLETMRKWSESASRAEEQTIAAIEHDREEAQRRAHDKSAISWSEYATSRGIADDTFQDYFARKCRESTDCKQASARNIAED